MNTFSNLTEQVRDAGEKLAYNQERADHKKDNRRSENGKRY